MGPRSFNRGNLKLLDKEPIAPQASMGPRSFNRGNVRIQVADGYTVMLQWGRGLSTAEMSRRAGMTELRPYCFNGAAVFQPRKCGTHCHDIRLLMALQWGRGLSTAEILAAADLPDDLSGFNGAAVFQPRKS